MGLGFYTGQVNRERRIRKRKELLEDRQAKQNIWQTQFDKQNEAAWQMPKKEQNKQIFVRVKDVWLLNLMY